MKNAIKKTFALVMTLCLLLVSVGALADNMTSERSVDVLKQVQALRKGSSGEAVRALSYQLQQHGYSSYVQSSFNETLRAALIRFQFDSGLTANGVADQTTIKAMLAGKGATTTKPQEIVKDPTPPGPAQSDDKKADNYMGNLKKANQIAKGEAGQAVRALTYQLKHYGYIEYVQSKYDATVVAAVQHFQSVHGLKTVNGVATKETIDKLLSGKNITVLQNVPGKVPATDPNLPVITDKVEDKNEDNYMGNLKVVSSLSAGAEGQSVRALTYLLKAKGYLENVQSKFDGVVKSAVMRFQFNNGLAADGVANKATISLLLSGKGLANKTPEQNGQEAPVTKPVDTNADSYMGNLKTVGSLSTGAKGQVVRALTYQLKGAKDVNGDPCIKYVKNSYDTEVFNAVAAFQAANGLGVTGLANATTITRLLGSK